MIIFQPSTADSTIRAGAPDVKYGTNQNLLVGEGLDYRLLLRFDLSSILPGTVISRAVISLYIESVNYQAGVWCYRLTQLGWIESEVTYNDYKSATPWSNPGGDYTTTDGVRNTGGRSVGNWEYYVVTNMVQHIIDNDGGIANFILIADEDLGAQYISYWSKEFHGQINRPRMIVSLEKSNLLRSNTFESNMHGGLICS